MKGDAQLNYLHAEISFSSMSQLSLLHNTLNNWKLYS